MKKFLSLAVAISAITLSSANVIGCLNWLDPIKNFVDDRTIEQKNDEVFRDKALNENVNNNSIFRDDRKVILIGLDGVAYEAQAPEIYGGMYDFENNTAIGKYKNNFYDSGVFQLQNYESEAGWNSIWYGNIFGPQKNPDTRNIFDIIKDGGGYTEAQMNNWVKTTYMPLKAGKQTLPNGDIYWPSEENDVCEIYLDEHGAELKMDEVLSWLAKMFTGNKNETWEQFEKLDDPNQINDEVVGSSGGGFQPADNSAVGKKINLYNIFNEILDVCGHSHFGFNSKVIKKIEEMYNTMFKKLFDPNLFPKDKYLILSVTDHGRNADGVEHFFSDPRAHESFIMSNHDLSQILALNENENGHKNVENLKLYDINTLVYTWLTSKKEPSSVGGEK
jgi:hypothetical protein